MKVNPLVMGSHAWAAAVAGPALIWTGWAFTGSLKTRLLLAGIGGVLIATHLPYLKAETKKLLPG